MSARKTVVLTGGGTGGHVTPNIALIPYLRQKGYRVCYVGSEKGMEKSLIEPLGISYYGIDSERLNRYFTLENLTMPFHVIRGLFQARKLLGKLKPDVVFSKGGFVSVPVVIAGALAQDPLRMSRVRYHAGTGHKLGDAFRIESLRQLSGCASLRAAGEGRVYRDADSRLSAVGQPESGACHQRTVGGSSGASGHGRQFRRARVE